LASSLEIRLTVSISLSPNLRRDFDKPRPNSQGPDRKLCMRRNLSLGGEPTARMRETALH